MDPKPPTAALQYTTVHYKKSIDCHTAGSTFNNKDANAEGVDGPQGADPATTFRHCEGSNLPRGWSELAV